MRRIISLCAALLLAAAAPAPHKVARNSPALEFVYVWPAEAAAIPKLDLKLYTEAKRDLARAQEDARDDQNLSRDDKREFHRHDYAKAWLTVGQSFRLLSLEGTIETFTGGAHPNHGNLALLWERRLGREIAVTDLFLRKDAFAALTRSAFCKALDAERLKRRGGERLAGSFNDCPKYSELAIAPVDRDRNGRFDTIRFVASPYVAGPYVEGPYEIALPVTSHLIAAIKPQYRNAFERQRQ
jgi:hypothetical protein